MSVTCRLVLVCDVDVTQTAESSDGGWCAGPYVETYTDHMGRGVSTDGATRATNFPVSLAGRLFGRTSGSSGQVRFSTQSLNVSWNTDVQPILSGQTSLRHAELLLSEPSALGQDSNRPGILALHFEVTAPSFADAVKVANLLARQRGGLGASPIHGALTYERLRGLHPELCRGLVFPTDRDFGAETESTVYSMILIDQLTAEDADPGMLSIKQAYSAASCQDIERLHASGEALDRASKSVLQISKSWSALFLRHGASFVVHTDVHDPFRSFMPIYFGTLYTDAVMLVRLQLLIVRQVETAAESLLERAAANPHLGSVSDDFENLDRQLAINSARYWMRRSESNAGNSIKIIHAIQDAMSFSLRLGALDAHIDGLARLSDADAQKQYLHAHNKLATVVTLLGSVAIPVTFATDLFQVLDLPVTLLSICGLAIGVFLLGGVTWWGLRRLLSKS